jgi:acetyl-CoA acetyltransferase
MNEPVYILGAGRTDFKRNLKKEGKALRDVIVEAGQKAIAEAKIDPAEIQAAAVGNFNAGQFTKQLHLGAFIPEIDEKLHGIPTMHTEAACASGALSVVLGAQWIAGGFHEAVLVVGAGGARGPRARHHGEPSSPLSLRARRASHRRFNCSRPSPPEGWGAEASRARSDVR